MSILSLLFSIAISFVWLLLVGRPLLTRYRFTSSALEIVFLNRFVLHVIQFQDVLDVYSGDIGPILRTFKLAEAGKLKVVYKGLLPSKAVVIKTPGKIPNWVLATSDPDPIVYKLRSFLDTKEANKARMR